MTSSRQPHPRRVDRPAIPAEYGAGRDQEYVPWEHVEARLARERVIWIATVAAYGQPRLRPVDALYVDGYVWVGGSPKTAWIRDITHRPRVSLHLDGVSDVVILEGEAEMLASIDTEQATRLAAASNMKFPEYRMTASAYRKGGAVRVRLRTVIAWTDFASNPTRFHLNSLRD